MPRFAKCLGLCAVLLVCSAAPLLAQGQPSYELISRNPGGLELRFHNMPLKEVHADDAQNALAVDFQSQVDGAVFDRLGRDIPDWIAMAYANYDTGLIRATRPVTFLTRQEPDGFSLRIVPRGPVAPQPGPGPVALRGPVDGQMPYGPPPPAYGPPPPAGGAFARYDSYGALRNYDMTELALHRDDAVWNKAYQRAAVESNSEVGLGTEYHTYHNGDVVIASQAHGKLAVGGGLSLIGSLYETDATADRVRSPSGTFATNTGTNLVTGAGGFALDLWNDTQVTLEALEGNNITGARFASYSGDPDSWLLADLSYHTPDLDTLESIWSRGFKDQTVIATGQHIGYGIWGSLAGKFDNYGVHGNASIAKTAGWDGNLRWSASFDGLLAGIGYDGHGEYLIDHTNFAGAAPTPYVPLSIRNMETHAVTASLSSNIWADTLWFDLYGGWVADRYASDGGIYGLALRYRPEPGVDLALGVRHSAVSLMQGETGGETSAGLSLTLGFDSDPVDSYF